MHARGRIPWEGRRCLQPGGGGGGCGWGGASPPLGMGPAWHLDWDPAPADPGGANTPTLSASPLQETDTASGDILMVWFYFCDFLVKDAT